MKANRAMIVQRGVDRITAPFGLLKTTSALGRIKATDYAIFSVVNERRGHTPEQTTGIRDEARGAIEAPVGSQLGLLRGRRAHEIALPDLAG